MGVIPTGLGTLMTETTMSHHSTDMPSVDRYELATILAALRLLQSGPALPPEIEEVATEQGDFERLDDALTDALRDRLDTAPDNTWHETIEDEPDRGGDDAALANRGASSRRSTDDAMM